MSKTMNTLFKLSFFAVFALIYGCAQTTPLPETTEDGLTLSSHKSINEVYVRPGFKLANYNSLSFETIELTYSDERRTKTPGLTDKDFQLSEKELQRFQERADKGFSIGLNKDNSGAGNLIVKHRIEDFYLTSPIKNNLTIPDKSFVKDSSRFTVVTELIDASNQQVVLRAKDKIKTGNLSANTNNLTRHSSVSYWQDVYQAFRRWGSRINGSFDS